MVQFSSRVIRIPTAMNPNYWYEMHTAQRIVGSQSGGLCNDVDGAEFFRSQSPALEEFSSGPQYNTYHMLHT